MRFFTYEHPQYDSDDNERRSAGVGHGHVHGYGGQFLLLSSS